jgi:hypothetical protein
MRLRTCVCLQLSKTNAALRWLSLSKLKDAEEKAARLQQARSSRRSRRAAMTLTRSRALLRLV